jgi:hypothetical protein
VDEINSITGREIPTIRLTPQDRRRGLAFLYACAGLLPALVRHGDRLAVAYWLITVAGFGAVVWFGQNGKSRNAGHTLLLLVAYSVAVVFIWGVPAPRTLRLMGLALVPIPYVADVVLARRARARA